MKKSLLNSVFLLVVLFFSMSFFSCKKKKFDDALPVVTIESVEVVSLDSVVLIGSISSQGADDIEYYGFSFSNDPSSNILANQVLFEGGNSTNFRAVVHALHDSTYYFKAFAANSFGYKVSNTIKYKVPRPAPVVVPCILANNYFNDNGLSFSVSAYGSSASPSYGNYEVNIYSPAEGIVMFFPYKPINGIYTTTTDGWNIGPSQVFIRISKFYLYYVNNGGKVYVNVDSAGTTSISVCNVEYLAGNTNYPLKGNVSFN